MGKHFEIGALDKIPFGRRLSRFMIYTLPNGDADNAPGIYLHLTADLTVSMRKRGLLRLAPTYAGEELEYTVSFFPEKLTMKTDRGNIEFAVDRPDILRIRANGVGLRAFSGMGRMEIPVEMNDGTFELSYSSAIGNILFVPTTGNMAFNSVWHIKDWKADDVTVDMTPDGSGTLEASIHEFNHAGSRLDIYRPFDECVAEAGEDFDRWKTLYNISDGSKELSELAAYITWVCTQQPRINGIVTALGGNAMYNRRYGLDMMNVFEQTVNALAFSDISAKRETVDSVTRLLAEDGMTPLWANDQNRQFGCAAPPSLALVLGDIGIDRELHESVVKMISWWFKWRDNDGDGLPEYAYPQESGFDAGIFPENGLPIMTPDLAGYLALASEILAKSGRADAPKWAELEKTLIDKLVRVLWDGDGFISRECATYRKTEPGDAFIKYVPVILGKSLPEDVAAKLADSIARDKPWRRQRGIPLGALLIFGLKRLGRDDIAREAADFYTETVSENGFVNNIGDEAYGSWCASAFLYASKGG
jgi:hypothetical protein